MTASNAAPLFKVIVRRAASKPLSARLRLAAALFPLACASAHTQTVNVSATVQLTRPPAHNHSSKADSSNVVVWLTPLQTITSATPAAPRSYTLAQKDKQFNPHILVVPTGSSVDFPNLDPFFHNVFSLFNGKRFDLGLYEAHTHRVMQFDRDGVSYIFCNIHPEMAAVVISLSTPYYAISSPDGTLTLHNVPPGAYRLNLWAENVSMDHLNALSRIVSIGPQNTQLGSLHLQATGNLMVHHTNKFGEPYFPPSKDPY